MNRKCAGHRFKIGKTNLYRCLFDGTVIKESGTVCHNCDRLISAAPELGHVDYREIKFTIPQVDDLPLDAIVHLIRHDDLFDGRWIPIVLPKLEALI